MSENKCWLKLMCQFRKAPWKSAAEFKSTQTMLRLNTSWPLALNHCIPAPLHYPQSNYQCHNIVGYFKGLPDLELVDLRFNQISRIDAYAFSAVPSITHLEITMNQLQVNSITLKVPTCLSHCHTCTKKRMGTATHSHHQDKSLSTTQYHVTYGCSKKELEYPVLRSAVSMTHAFGKGL